MPRWMHKLYARFFGFFWLPCPLCGDLFGGHEWRSRAAVLWHKDRSGGTGVCEKCIPEAQERNRRIGVTMHDGMTMFE